MHLSEEDKESLMNRFPNIKLCYESKIEHNKVSADYYTLIPKGKKYFLWITYFKNFNKIAFLMETNKEDIIDLKPVKINFKKDYALGTLLYGTLFYNNRYAIEDIYYYKGKNYDIKTNNEKLIKLKEFLNDLPDTLDLNIGIPYMSIDINDCYRMSNLVPYGLYSIQYKKYNLKNNKIFFEFANNHNKVIKETYVSFEITADNQNDIYHAHYGKNTIYHTTLMIPDYKTSVLMNSLFRNIKENRNLDSLEESDDEEEFENISEDKFLLNKKFIIDCKYNKKLKKWIPVQLSKNKFSIDNIHHVLNIEASNNKFKKNNNFVKKKPYLHKK
jgi:hypothetical protein